jgi:hypothetical protein
MCTSIVIDRGRLRELSARIIVKGGFDTLLKGGAVGVGIDLWYLPVTFGSVCVSGCRLPGSKKALALAAYMWNNCVGGEEKLSQKRSRHNLE